MFIFLFIMDFYRVNQAIKYKKSLKSDSKLKMIKKRYLVLTDIYFLLFDPIVDQSNLAMLILVGDIRDLVSCDDESVVSSKTNTITLKWKDCFDLGDNVIIYKL